MVRWCKGDLFRLTPRERWTLSRQSGTFKLLVTHAYFFRFIVADDPSGPRWSSLWEDPVPNVPGNASVVCHCIYQGSLAWKFSDLIFYSLVSFSRDFMASLRTRMRRFSARLWTVILSAKSRLRSSMLSTRTLLSLSGLLFTKLTSVSIWFIISPILHNQFHFIKFCLFLSFVVVFCVILVIPGSFFFISEFFLFYWSVCSTSVSWMISLSFYLYFLFFYILYRLLYGYPELWGYSRLIFF